MLIGRRGHYIMTASRRVRHSVVREAIEAVATALRRAARKGADDTSGAAAVEFALVALPFILLVFLALQTVLVFMFSEALQTATIQTSRMIMTGQSASDTQSQFQNAVCANLPSMFNCSGVMVDVQSVSGGDVNGFSTLNTAPLVPAYSNTTGKVTNSWSFQQGQPGDVVIVRVMYDWPVLGGIFGFANQPNGTYLMVGTAVFENEPYDSGLSS